MARSRNEAAREQLRLWAEEFDDRADALAEAREVMACGVTGGDAGGS
jgi:hypothetical protein